MNETIKNSVSEEEKSTPEEVYLETEKNSLPVEQEITKIDIDDDLFHDDDFLNEIIEEENYSKTVSDFGVVRKPQKVTLETPVYKEQATKENLEKITLPSDTTEIVQQKLNRSKIADLMNKKDPLITPDMVKWFASIQDGDELLPFAGMYNETFEKEDSDWHQNIDHNGVKLQGRGARVGQKRGVNVQGDQAVLQILGKFGYGIVHQQPLWHSGIWITFRAPSDGDIIELHRRLIYDKIRWGRNDYGLSLSAVTTYTTDRLIEFVLENIHATTVNKTTIPNNDLKNIIVAQDIPLLLHGLAVTMFTNGFQYERACTANPNKCYHVASGLINLGKLLVVDRNAMTPWQREHMSKRASNEMSYTDIQRYQSEMRSLHKSAFNIKTQDEDEITVIIKTPTINEFLAAGFKWIDGIRDLVEKLMGSDAPREEKEEYMFKNGKATALRQYRHWIDSIQFDENTLNDPDTLDSLLNRFSSMDEIRDKFLEEITKYINRSTIALVGIPEYTCPECEGINKADDEIKLINHPNMIPIDVQRLFFYLLVQRSLKISER